MQNNDAVVVLELNKKLASKKEIKFTLLECLADLTKDRLSKLASNYKIANRSKMKKDELAEAIYNEITSMNAVKEKALMLDEKSVALIKELADNEKITATSEALAIYEEILNLAFVFTYLENDQIVMVMPKEIKEALSEVKDNDNAVNSEDIIDEARYNEVTKYIVGFAEAYGMYEPSVLIETFNRQNDEELTEDELNKVIDGCSPAECRVFRHEGLIVQDSLLMIEDGIARLKEQREGKDYYSLSKEKVTEYANGAYIEMTNAHHNLRNKLIEVCKDQKVGNEIFEDICDSLMFLDLNTHFVISEFNRRKIQVNTYKEFEIILSLAKKVNDNTRKWGNKGYTHNELALLASKKLVGRNEPCVCGSGRKYKKCCGR